MEKFDGGEVLDCQNLTSNCTSNRHTLLQSPSFRSILRFAVMATQVGAMQGLASLLNRVDHFSPVCAFLNGFDLCKLWFCGDVQMLQVLRLCVTRFDVVFAVWERPSFPNLVAQFPRLEHFLLHTESHAALLHGFDLQKIPKSIRSIDCYFANDFVNFLCAKPASNDAQPIIQLRKLDQLFPQLEYLRCKFQRPVEELNFAIHPNRLPSGLQTLKLGEPLPISVDLLRHLPENLLEIPVKLILRSPDDLGLASLPSHLTSLFLEEFKYPALMRCLPQHLTSLCIFYSSEIEDETLPLFWDCLPSGLVTFTATCAPHLDLSMFESLPRELEKLHISAAKSPLSCAMTMALPPNLTYFSFSRQWAAYREAPDTELIKHLPKRLKTFQFSSVRVPFDWLEFLPPSLENLPNSLTEDCPPQYWKHLPRGLKSLSVKFGAQNSFSTLPTGLTWLGTDTFAAGIDYPFTKIVSLHLERLTTAEQWLCLNFCEKTLKQLFVDLVSCAAIDLVSQSGELKIRPEKLLIRDRCDDTPKRAIYTIDVSRPWLQNVKSIQFFIPIMLENLSMAKTLEELTLVPFRTPTFVDILFELPENLTFLSWSRVLGRDAGTIERKHLMALPKRISTLMIASHDITLTDEDLTLLPKSVMSVSFGDSPWFRDPIGKLHQHLHGLNFARIPKNPMYPNPLEAEMMKPKLD